MNRLVKVSQERDIFPHLRDTPVGRLLRYHNLGEAHEAHPSAELLIGMCMDNRKSLRIPDNFAFVIRAGGGNLRYSEFKVSFAVAVGGVRAIALIGHTSCGMVNLSSRREQFIDGLVRNAGWDRAAAEEHFAQFAPTFEIGNEVDFVLSESKRLRGRYPKVLVAPMIYKVEDNLLYLVREER